VAHAVPLARALVAGGIRMLEVTLRTPVALACIEAIAKDVPDAVVGAGNRAQRRRRAGPAALAARASR
jgi:2-dehydro-3-deoxyphosphogluconate aldolase/(4S)-4-hydroxy-2-oxoglutarate aldolase